MWAGPGLWDRCPWARMASQPVAMLVWEWAATYKAHGLTPLGGPLENHPAWIADGIRLALTELSAVREEQRQASVKGSASRPASNGQG